MQPSFFNINFIQNAYCLNDLVQRASAFHDMLPKDDEPFAFLHHAAFFAKDYHAERDQFAAAGCPIISEFAFDNAHVCYADTRAQLGHFVEIYPEHPVIRSMYAQTKAARQDRPGAMVLEHFQF